MWHGIEKDRALKEKEIDFIAELIMAWIERELDDKTGFAV